MEKKTKVNSLKNLIMMRELPAYCNYIKYFQALLTLNILLQNAPCFTIIVDDIPTRSS